MSRTWTWTWKPTYLVTLLLLWTVPSLAREPGTAPRLAARFADAIDAHYNKLHSLQARFVQSYDGLGMHRVERGTLLLSKAGRLHAGRMRWSYTEPAGKLFVLDGKDAYFYTPGQSEVQSVPARQLDDLRSPLALLLGHAELAKQLSGLRLTSAANGESMLAGVPRGLERRVAELEVTADAGGVIHRLEIDEVDGGRNVFEFADEQPDAPAAAREFVFTPPPGTHVVKGTAPI